MKVYVVFAEYEWEGCGFPEKAFNSQEKAEAYIQEKYAEALGCDYSYVDLEVE
jgi:hypothetical protein